MKRYIDAEILKNKILDDMAKAERDGKDLNGYTDALFHLKTTPAADVVEVVRCRECKHYVRREYPFCEFECEGAEIHYKPDDYCSYGERREE